MNDVLGLAKVRG